MFSIRAKVQTAQNTAILFSMREFLEQYFYIILVSAARLSV